MATLTFTASVARFEKLTNAGMLATVIDSLQDELEAMQTSAQGVTAGGHIIEGRIPHVSGDLVNSLAIQINGAPGGKGKDSYILAIAGMSLGDLIRFGWTMEYAARVHSGFMGPDSLGRVYNQQGWHWITPHAARWPQIVRRNAARHRRAG